MRFTVTEICVVSCLVCPNTAGSCLHFFFQISVHRKWAGDCKYDAMSLHTSSIHYSAVTCRNVQLSVGKYDQNSNLGSLIQSVHFHSLTVSLWSLQWSYPAVRERGEQRPWWTSLTLSLPLRWVALMSWTEIYPPCVFPLISRAEIPVERHGSGCQECRSGESRPWENPQNMRGAEWMLRARTQRAALNNIMFI